jgi:hypothetical protein
MVSDLLAQHGLYGEQFASYLNSCYQSLVLPHVFKAPPSFIMFVVRYLEQLSDKHQPQKNKTKHEKTQKTS